MKNRSLSILAALAMMLGMGMLVTAPASADIIWTGTPVVATPAKDLKGGVDAPKWRPNSKELNGKATCGSPSVCYTHVGVNQFVGPGTAGVGADAALVSVSQHKPYKDTADFHSLWELAVESSNQLNIVEIGWTMDAGVCGAVFTAGNPCLFVYHWVNGAKSCYNGCGWIDNPTEPVNAGTALATTAGGASPTVFNDYRFTKASSVKCDNVTTDGTPVQTTSTPGWLGERGPAGGAAIIGCFPDLLWTAAGVTFDKVQMVQAFTELAAADDHSCSDLGSGIFSPAAWGTLSASLWQKTYTLTNPPAGVTPAWGGTASVLPSFNTPTAYRILKDPSSNEVREGGAGFDVQGGTATGTAGNC